MRSQSSEWDRLTSSVLAAGLRRYVRLRRRTELEEGAAATAAVLLGALAGVLIVERLLRPSPAGCLALLLLFIVVTLLTVFHHILRPILMRPNPLGVALELEQSSGRFNDELSSAVQFSLAGGEQPGVSRELAETTVSRAEQRLQDFPIDLLFDRRRLRRRILHAAVPAGLLLVLWLLMPQFFLVALRRTFLLSEIAWPTKTRLAFEPELTSPVHIPFGTTLDVSVQVDPRGVVPDRLRLTIEREGGRLRRWMTAVDRLEHAARIGPLTEPVEVSVRGGDARLGPVRIVPVERPVVTRLEVTCEPPRHTGIDSFPVPLDTPSPEVPGDSRVTVLTRTDRPVPRFVCYRARPEDSAADEPLQVHEVEPARQSPLFTFAAADDLALLFRVVDGLGIASEPPVQLNLKTIADEKPQVRVDLEGVRENVTTTAWFSVRATAEDDYGVREIHLKSEHEQATGPAALFTASTESEAPRARSLMVARQIDLAEIGAKPAQTLRFEAWALDNDEPAHFKRGQADPVTVKVLSRSDYLAVVLVRQQTYRVQLESVMQEMARAREGAGQWEQTRRSGAASTRSVADGYDAILEELWHNRIIRQDARDRYREGIVHALSRLVGKDGPLRPGGQAESAARAAQALAVLRDVRDRMLLLEQYSGLISTVESLIQRQQEIIEKTRRAP